MACDDSVITALVNVYGSKNLAKITGITQTISDVTYTINSDGSVTTSGTATDHSWYNYSDIILKKGTYTYNGSPKGSSPNKLSYIYNVETTQGYPDHGNGVTFTLDHDTNIRVVIYHNTGQVGNETYYPMLRDASIKDDTYVPYAMTNKEVTDVIKGPSWVNKYNTFATIPNKYPNTIDEDINFGNNYGLYGIMFFQGAAWGASLYLLEVTSYHAYLTPITSNSLGLTTSLKSSSSTYPIIVNFKTTSNYSGNVTIFRIA